MTSELGARVLPPIRRPGSLAYHLIERNLILYRRIWIVLFSGFFEPVFYLLSIGLGVGFLVNQGVTLADGRVVTYMAFVAPALLASSAMNGAIYESTLNVFFRLKWGKVYDGILATPLQPLDIALGEIAWSQIRGCIYAIGFTTVMSLFGLVTSLWGILAIPIALLIGFAFAGMGMAATTFMKGWQDFDLVQLVIQPLFLFSGTFFPVSQYPGWLQVVVQISPLYHGIELLRAVMLNSFDWSVVGHVSYLVVLGAIGLRITQKRFTKLLMP